MPVSKAPSSKVPWCLDDRGSMLQLLRHLEERKCLECRFALCFWRTLITSCHEWFVEMHSVLHVCMVLLFK
jgi:hypothetical protein